MKQSSTHLFTSREEKSFDRVIVLFAMVVFGIFSLCSVYSIVLVPSNPAAWSMAGFFIGGLFLLLLWEDNTFPAIEKKAFPGAILMWLSGFIFIAFLVSFLFTLNLSHLGAAIMFGIIVFIGGSVATGVNLREKVKHKKKTTKKRRVHRY